MIPKFINRSKIPHKPGVYIYKDESGSILYVGKAIDLYQRITSYFNGHPDSPKTAALVEKINSVETIEVISELEALLLEANLIKKYLPPFNIKLTDDAGYLYIKVTQEDFPKVLTARKADLKDAKYYFGPFPSAQTVRETLKKLRRIFPWCSLTQIKLTAGNFRSRPCFYYHLGLCPGPCAGEIDKKEYNKNIRMFVQFMEGKKETVLKELNMQMEDYARDLKFEEAEKVKRTIQGVNYLTQSNHTEVYLENPNFIEDQNTQALVELQRVLGLTVLPERIECFDISNIQGYQSVGSLVVLTRGEVDKKWYRKFKISLDGKPNDFAMMAEMIHRRLKHKEWPFPDLFLVDGGRGQVRATQEELIRAGVRAPLYGLAKRMEWLYTAESKIIKLKKSSPALRLLQKIRDEAHRFALNYHRQLRSRNLILGLYNKY